MLTDKIKKLEAAKATVEALEQEIAAERANALAALPAQYGFADVESFIAAIRGAGSAPRRGRKPRASSPKAGKRKRAKITDETRAEVKKLVQGGKTGSEIAKALGISLPSVQNIKKALGLVKTGRKG